MLCSLAGREWAAVLDLYVVLGWLAGFIFVVLMGFLFSKKLGELEAQSRSEKKNRETQRRISRILARRDRNRGELTDWMRDQADD